MKRFLSSLLTGILFFSSIPFARAEFSDVSTSHPHYVAVSTLVDQGILEGYGDGTFKPDQAVNRAEALKIILMGMDVDVTTGSSAGLLFSDVTQSDWFSTIVGTAVTRAIVQGYDDGTFKPAQTVNRAEAVKMLTLAGGVELPEAAASFDDVDVNVWYAPYATYAKTWNLVTPQTDGLWHGEALMSRGDIAEMVYRLQVVRNLGGSFDEATNWLRTTFTTVNVSLKVPFGWGVKTDGVGAAFLLDAAEGQVSLLAPYSNGATLLMTRYSNPDEKSVEELFETIRSHSNLPVTELSLNSYPTLRVEHGEGTTYREWYIALPNGSIVNFVGMRGEGAYAHYLEWFLNAMVESVNAVAVSSSDMTLDEILAELRSAIQVDAVGQEMMDLLNDWTLFETDTIGVGTGPVDYFYSPSLNVTVKYERSYDVILDIMEGKTSAF